MLNVNSLPAMLLSSKLVVVIEEGLERIGMSHDDFANRLGISKEELSDIFMVDSIVTLELLGEMLRIIGLDIHVSASPRDWENE